MTMKKFKSLFSKEKQNDITEELTSFEEELIKVRMTDALREASFEKPSEDGYLTGTLLVASPLVTDSIFQKSVIYLFAHGADGAMGCILNEPVDTVNYAALLGDLDASAAESNGELPVFFGGPVERSRGFVLHSSEYKPESALHTQGDVSITTVSGILRDMVQGNGPEHASLIVGYAGWSEGQLEEEIEQNAWLTVPATRELVFETPTEHQWARASQSIGVDMAFYSHSVGHA